jgi:glycosyltransferase involved in cell wall biosynthesis
MRVAIWHQAGDVAVPGGHRVQMTKLADELERLGHTVVVSEDGSAPKLGGVDIVHGQGIEVDQVAHAHRAGVAVVLSPVYWSSSYRMDADRIRSYLSRGRSSLGASRAAWQGRLVPVVRRDGARFFSTYASAEACDRLLPNARGEYDQMVEELGVSTPATIVPNAADPAIFDAGPSPASRNRVVVCAGRVEPHKNQLALIHATRSLGVKLLIVGDPHPHHAKYFAACQEAARASDVEFIPQLPPARLAEIFEQSAVHALPSWFETTGLVSLEAALAGARIVSTDRGHAREYLRGDAWYCSPASWRSIRNALATALDAPWRPVLRERILTHFTWEKAAAATVEGYEAALAEEASGRS